MPPDQRPVRALDIEKTEKRKYFHAMEVAAVQLDDSQLITVKVESGNYKQFQPDTRAQCNVIPLIICKKATRDLSLSHVTPAQASTYNSIWRTHTPSSRLSSA